MTPGTPHSVRSRAAAIPLAAVLALSACGGGTPSSGAAGGLDRETFIRTYVDLRTEAVQAGTPELGEEARTRILERHGVTEEALMGFIEIHGEDVDFMRALWDEVEVRLDAARIGSGPEGPP